MPHKLFMNTRKHITRVIIIGLTVAAFAALMLPSVRPLITQAVRNSIAGITERVITTISPGPIIIERLQALNRLESARQVGRHVVEAKSDSRAWPKFLFKDDLMMLVQTETVAGIDFSKLSKDDISIDHGVVSIRLPSPEILYTKIDDTDSKVYMRRRGLLVFNPNMDLERQARLRAEADARNAALSGGLLLSARTNAEQNIKGILKQMGFERVEFRWHQYGLGTVDDV